LIALVALPCISLIVYSGIAARHEAVAGAEAECFKLVNDIAGQQQALVAGAEQLATALSLLPPIQSRNPAAATAIFADLLEKNPQYANILVCDKSGVVWASAIPFEGKVSLADRRFFQETLRTGTFSSGEYVVSRMVKRPTMAFGYPVKNRARKLIAVIGIALDLEYIRHIFEKLSLPPGSLLALLDRKGIILFRNVNDSAENLSGGPDPQRELFTRMTEGPDEGTFEAMGNDARFRLRAYKKMRLPHESAPYLYIRSGIPLASAVSKANAALFRNLSAFVSLFLMGLFLAWLIGRRVIVNPAMTLKAASERLAAGADTVHVSSVVKGGELGEVALAFDGMAEALVQRETALRISEQRWATILASIGDAVIAADVEGKITFMNAVAEELTGWKLCEASMKPVAEVFHVIDERSRAEAESPVAKVLRQGMIIGLADHTVLARKDGTEVPIDDSGAPIRDAEGRTMGVVLVFRDITGRRTQDEERAKLLSAVERAGEGVFMLTPDRRYSYVNAAFCKAYGFTQEELTGKDTTVVRSDRHAQSFHDSIWSGLRAGNTCSGRQTRRKKDGELIEVQTTIAPVREASGAIIHYVGVERDITEQLRIEAQLRQAQKMEAVGTLAGGVAHDFNNILSVIMGLGNLMQMSMGKDDIHRTHIDQIVASSERAAELTQSLLAFSRKQRITLTPHTVNGVVESTAMLLKRLLPEDIALKCNFTDGQTLTMLDVTRMGQVLMNLATNARDAMPQGGSLTITTEPAKLDENFNNIHGFGKQGNYVKLSVSDTGIGMDESTMKRIFEPFFTTKEVGKGTGLGLASAYGIVKQHDGYITVSSTLSKGTTFDIYLPLIDTPPPRRAFAAPAIEGGTETILIVEDDRDVRTMIALILKNEGYATIEAADGNDAIRLYDEHRGKVDLVILDVVMPGKNGKEVLDEITRINPSVKAVFVSGYTGDIVIDKGIESESVDFLQKPLSVSKLLSKVREVLDR
jgi:PAS domain S-box-containing protein